MTNYQKLIIELADLLITMFVVGVYFRIKTRRLLKDISGDLTKNVKEITDERRKKEGNRRSSK